MQKKIPFYFKSNYTKDRLILRNLISSVLWFFGQRQGCYFPLCTKLYSIEVQGFKAVFNFLYLTFLANKEFNLIYKRQMKDLQFVLCLIFHCNKWWPKYEIISAILLFNMITYIDPLQCKLVCYDYEKSPSHSFFIVIHDVVYD